MTENKPIMIDGVDVSGCEAYKDEHCKDKTSIMFCNTNLCSNFPNCYFKQLARKTQECEELKDKIKFMEGYIKTVENARDELERENKFSKEQAEQKLEKIRQICNCSKNQMNCEQCPMCDECEELCVNDENLQDIILQIIDEVE